MVLPVSQLSGKYRFIWIQDSEKDRGYAVANEVQPEHQWQKYRYNSTRLGVQIKQRTLAMWPDEQIDKCELVGSTMVS